MPPSFRPILLCLTISLAASAAEFPFERKPIDYHAATANDRIAQLQKRIDAGEVVLKFDKQHGYLPSVLDALKISPTSQMLVFSKTSLQFRRIAPWAPRALYFNDDAYVGWVNGGNSLEVSAVDPQLGAVFYTLSQQPAKQPRFVRDTGNCLSCHASSRTYRTPGHLARSVYPAADGQPHFSAGTFRTTHASPLEQRWGGWFVSGTHGRMRHLGNVTADKSQPRNMDVEAGANVTDLSELTRIQEYLTPHSDIVALLIHDHQTDTHNLITLANHETRMALHQAAVINRALDRPEDYVSDSARRRIDRAAEKLVEGLLLANEAPLTDRVQGVSGFAQHFVAQGRKDSRGRSLRELDLRRRLFKYPCSYLIYSDAFAALPPLVKQRTYQRLREVLSGQDQSETFARLSPKDRRAVYEILSETLEGLPEDWKAKR